MTTINPGLAPVQTSSFTLKQYGLRIPKNNLTYNPRPQVGIQRLGLDYYPILNQINEQISTDNIALKIRESYENSGYTPEFTGQQNKAYAGLGNFKGTPKLKQEVTKTFNEFFKSPPSTPSSSPPTSRRGSKSMSVGSFYSLANDTEIVAGQPYTGQQLYEIPYSRDFNVTNPYDNPFASGGPMSISSARSSRKSLPTIISPVSYPSVPSAYSSGSSKGKSPQILPAQTVQPLTQIERADWARGILDSQQKPTNKLVAPRLNIYTDTTKYKDYRSDKTLAGKNILGPTKKMTKGENQVFKQKAKYLNDFTSPSDNGASPSPGASAPTTSEFPVLRQQNSVNYQESSPSTGRELSSGSSYVPSPKPKGKGKGNVYDRLRKI